MTKFEETTQELDRANFQLERAKQEVWKTQVAHESAVARYDRIHKYVRYLEYTIEGMLDETNKFGRTTEA